MPSFERDGIRFHYRDEGRGLPFVFQHGLGGEISQPFGLYRPASGIRMVAFDMRGHGGTRPAGELEKLTIASLADDLVALLDHLAIPRAVVGGISLGAAVAVSATVRFAERVCGLVLVRPAWIDRPLDENVNRYKMIAHLIRDLGPTAGLEHFWNSASYHSMHDESPDCAKSLLGQFEEPRALECVARLERLASDTLCTDRGDYRRIDVPTLIVGNRQDPIHPWNFAETLAQLIRGAELCQVTPKSVSRDQHAADVQKVLDSYFSRRFLKTERLSC